MATGSIQGYREAVGVEHVFKTLLSLMKDDSVVTSINNLTCLANRYSAQATKIVEQIEIYLKEQTQPTLQIAGLKLITSIGTKCKKEYSQYFAINIVDTFCRVFASVNANLRHNNLQQLRKDWESLFPPGKLHAIDNRCHSIDPTWEIFVVSNTTKSTTPPHPQQQLRPATLIKVTSPLTLLAKTGQNQNLKTYPAAPARAALTTVPKISNLTPLETTSNRCSFPMLQLPSPASSTIVSAASVQNQTKETSSSSLDPTSDENTLSTTKILAKITIQKIPNPVQPPFVICPIQVKESPMLPIKRTDSSPNISTPSPLIEMEMIESADSNVSSNENIKVDHETPSSSIATSQAIVAQVGTFENINRNLTAAELNNGPPKSPNITTPTTSDARNSNANQSPTPSNDASIIQRIGQMAIIPFNEQSQPLASLDTRGNAYSTNGNWRIGKSITKMMEYVLEHDEDTHKDVVFLVGPEREEILAHKLILRIVSPVFDNLFHVSALKNTQDILRLVVPDLLPSAFRLLLRYIYSRRVEVDTQHALQLLKAANKFQFNELSGKCRSKLRLGLNNENSTELFQYGMGFDTRLKELALSHIELNARRVFQTDGFMDLTRDSLCEILKSDSLRIDELPIFNGAIRWANNSILKRNSNRDMKINGLQIREELGPVLYLIRLPTLTSADFALHVMKLGVLTPEEISSVFLANLMINADENASSQLSQIYGDNESSCPFSSTKRIGASIKTTVSVATSSTEANQDEERMSRLRGAQHMDEAEVHSSNRVSPPPPKIPRTDISRDVEVQIQTSTPSLNDASSQENMDTNEERNNVQETSPEPLINEPVAGTSRSFSNPLVASEDSESNSYESRHQDSEQEEESSIDGSVPESNESDNTAHPQTQKKKVANHRKTNDEKILSPEQEKYIQENIDNNSNGNNLHSFYQNMLTFANCETAIVNDIKEISELINPIVINPTKTFPLNFPGLKDFHIHYLSNNKTVNAFKNYLKNLDLSTLIFFKKQEEEANNQDFHGLWNGGINTTIIINGLTVLKIDVNESTLVLCRANQVVVESILIGIGLDDAGVRSIHMDECKINDLNMIPSDNLESLTLRRVKGIKCRAEFLRKCKNLVEFSCSEMGDENIDLGLDFGLLTPEGSKLKRLAMGKAKINCSTPLNKLDNQIEEVYFDGCQFASNLVDGFHLIFPNLKKIKICRNITPRFFWKILKIESIEWICIWELELRDGGSKRKKGKVSIKPPTELSLMIQELKQVLENSGLDKTWVSTNNNKKTFILEKIKVEQTVEGRIEESQGLNMDNGAVLQENPGWIWKGTRITNKLDVFNKLDYEQFGWSKPFSDYDFYHKLNK